MNLFNCEASALYYIIWLTHCLTDWVTVLQHFYLTTESYRSLNGLLNLRFISDIYHAYLIYNSVISQVQTPQYSVICDKKWTEIHVLNVGVACWNPQILSVYPQSIALHPQFSILNVSFSILLPQISLIKPQVSVFNPSSSKEHYIWLKKSSK